MGHAYNFIVLNNISDILGNNFPDDIEFTQPEIRKKMGLEGIDSIEVFNVEKTMPISVIPYIYLSDDAKRAKVLESLNSATILRSPGNLSDTESLPPDSSVVHFIVDYPRDLCISYAAYIVGQLNHRSSIVISNKADVSTLRRMIAKDLEREEDLLQLFSAWDGFLDHNEFPSTLTVVGRTPLQGHTILSDVIPLKVKRRIDVIVYVGLQKPNSTGITNTSIPSTTVPTAAEESRLLLLEGQEFTRRAHEEANRRAAESMEQLRDFGEREKAERQPPPPQGDLMKQDKLETRKEEEKVAKTEQEVEGGKAECDPKKALETKDFLKAMMDEQRRQTDLLTGMLAEQREHGKKVESLLLSLDQKPNYRT